MKTTIKKLFQFPLFEKAIAFLSANRRVNHLFARLPAYCSFYPPNSVRRVRRKGIFYELDLSDYMEWLVFFGIRVEPRDKLYALVRPNQVVLDIGSNIGEVALNLAKRVGNGGQVHSFEPDPTNFQKMKRNVQLNRLSNLTLYNIGLGDRAETVTLAPESKNNRGGVRVTKPGHHVGNNASLVALDVWMNDAACVSLDLIKMDVEGYELKVLRGGERTLRNYHPMLFIELDNDNLKSQGDSARELIAFLIHCGYSKILNADTGTAVGTDTDFAGCHFDIIAR